MSNHITASVEFYFRGKKISSAVEIDLEKQMESTGRLADVYPLLAKAAQIDIYSYEYEMMQAETIIYSHANGLCAQYCKQNCFDFDAFSSAWAENNVIDRLTKIAQTHLSIDDLSGRPDIKNALLEAFKLGKAEKRK